jgi:nucleotide-binding universal stress UspA family protein
MQRIVMAVKPGSPSHWLADAAAEIAGESGAGVAVIALDGIELEALSPTPRSAHQASGREAVDTAVARLKEQGVAATGEARSGPVVRGVLLFAEELDADLIVTGGTTRGKLASRVLGSVPLELISRSRRPVLVITPPPN